MSEKKYFILISAGGTGGHMSPAAALAHNLIERGYRVELTTDIRGKKYASMFGGVKIHVVKSGTSFAGILGKVRGAVNLGLGVIHSFKLIKSLSPDLVIGFGGYPSVPAVFAAQKLKIPTILHEQNAIIGKANAFLAPRSERIALSMPYVSGLEKADQFRCVITGNPVRAEISDLADTPYPELNMDDEIRIFIMGGSLGASVFSDIIPKALSKLPEEYKKCLKIVQQCRASDIEEARELYKNAGIDAELETFFDDVAQRLLKAHLFIGRSGASTVAEVSVIGTPAIYVPYPHHKDQQQKMNAESVASKGGAWIMEERNFTVDALLEKIESFISKPDTLLSAASHAKSCGSATSAKKLGNLVIAIVTDYYK